MVLSVLCPFRPHGHTSRTKFPTHTREKWLTVDNWTQTDVSLTRSHDERRRTRLSLSLSLSLLHNGRPMPGGISSEFTMGKISCVLIKCDGVKVGDFHWRVTTTAMDVRAFNSLSSLSWERGDSAGTSTCPDDFCLIISIDWTVLTEKTGSWSGSSGGNDNVTNGSSSRANGWRAWNKNKNSFPQSEDELFGSWSAPWAEAKEIKKKKGKQTHRQTEKTTKNNRNGWGKKTSNKFAALVVGFSSRLGVLRAGVQIKRREKQKLPHYIIILFWLVSRQPSDELFWQVSARHWLALKECLKASNVVKFTQRAVTTI